MALPDFDSSNLPKSSAEEDLETISINRLKLLFDPKKFEVRQEIYRDKGIDLIIEIKVDERYTNFRFPIQLKATKSRPKNQDGSFSFSVNSSNIEYLMNSDLPGYYVLYESNSNIFFYVTMAVVFASVTDKSKDWRAQETHNIRFFKELSPLAVQEIYEYTLNLAIKKKQLNDKLIYRGNLLGESEQVLIDKDFNILNEGEIEKLIDRGGLILINGGRWEEVISLHSKITGQRKRSSSYNLAVGLAYYYTGKMYDALSFLKKAFQFRQELPNAVSEYLEIMFTLVKYAMGLVSIEEYNQSLEKFDNNPAFGPAIALERATREFLVNSANGIDKKFEIYETEILKILNDPKTDINTNLNARCELILIWGNFNKSYYGLSVTNINAAESMLQIPVTNLRKQVSDGVNDNYQKWLKLLNEVESEAETRNMPFVYCTATVNAAKVMYEFYVLKKHVYFGKLGNQNNPESDTASIELLLEKVEGAILYFKHIGHLENTIVSHSLKYQLLHYLGRMREAEDILNELEADVEVFDLPSFKRQFALLKNKGAYHQLFEESYWEQNEKQERNRLEFERLRSEIVQMNNIDLKVEPQFSSGWSIQLYPLGCFHFPIDKVEIVFSILGISNEDLKKQLLVLFPESAPIINLNDFPITEVGSGNHIVDNGIESTRQQYEIRCLFRDNGFRFFIPT